MTVTIKTIFKFVICFTISAGVLKSSGTFDYETRTYYNVTFNITDTKATSGPYVLDVHILNAEEPCYFVDSNYYMSAYEGNVS